MAFKHLKRAGKSIARFFGKGKNQQTNQAAENVNEITGQQAAAFQSRGLSGSIRDLRDRYKYWSGGGGRNMDNKTRNWLIAGEEGSWRRNKAERQATKEYETGLSKIQEINKLNRLTDLLNSAAGEGAFDELLYEAADGKDLGKEEVGTLQNYADEIKEYMVQNGMKEDSDYKEIIMELADIIRLEGETNHKTGDNGYYDEVLKSGKGNIEFGLVDREAKERFFSRYNDVYQNMSGAERSKFRQEKTKEILENELGGTEEETQLSDEYMQLLVKRNMRNENATYAVSLLNSQTAAERRRVLAAKIENKYKGFDAKKAQIVG